MGGVNGIRVGRLITVRIAMPLQRCAAQYVLVALTSQTRGSLIKAFGQDRGYSESLGAVKREEAHL